MASIKHYPFKNNSSSQFLNMMNPKPVFRNVSLGQVPQRLLLQVNTQLDSLTENQDKSDYRDQVLKSFHQDFFIKNLLSLCDDEIKQLASTKAKACANNQLFISGFNQWSDYFNQVIIGLNHLDIAPPSTVKEPNEKQIISACKRLTNELWWRRVLRKSQLRLIEKEHLKIGHISRKTKQLYVSNEVLSKRQAQKQRNRDLLESINAVNDSGYENDLKSLSDVSTSNPKIRRNELMARLKGLEEYADSIGYCADFYTFTAPSKYHRYASKTTAKKRLFFFNDKYENFTPRQTQQFLNSQWAKIRSEFHRRNINIFGLRVAEPHHDGTPHWHLLLFFDKQNRTQIRQIFRHYALEHHADEPGAQHHRFTAIKIRKQNKHGKKLSAVGYICKYIAKNLSFDDLKTDSFNNDGQDTKETVNRVEAWANVWGIRQFQQIGGERITPWRELRRLRDTENLSIPAEFQQVHLHADQGNYAEYIKACAKQLKIQIIRKYSNLAEKIGNRHIQVTRINMDTGEYHGSSFYKDRNFTNFFDELKMAPIVGLSIGSVSLITRINEWTTQARRASRQQAAQPLSLGLVSLTVPIYQPYH